MDLSSIPLKDLTVLALGGFLGVGAYFAKRRIQGDKTKERLEHFGKALDLRQKLKAEGLTADDLQSTIDLVLATNTKRRSIEDRVTGEIVRQKIEIDGPVLCQTEMNFVAAMDLKIADARLERTLFDLKKHLGREKDSLIEESQTAWQNYAVAQSKLDALYCEGGTMYPTVRRASQEAITVKRIAEIEELLEYLKTL